MRDMTQAFISLTRMTNCLRVALLAAIAVVACAEPTHSQVLSEDFWTPNAAVQAAVLSGSTLYLAGGFYYFGPQTGGGVQVSATTGVPAGGYPRVQGSVLAVVPDGVGGWFIGGSFSVVGGLPRAGLAHIRADQTVASWDPGVTGLIRTLVLSGSTLYAGGQFTTIGGQSRTNLAAIDTSTGSATSWNPGVTGSPVYCIAASADGQTIYAAGAFTGLGGQPRNYIGAVDVTTGLATSWDPHADNGVRALWVDGSTIYAGGTFGSIGGLARVDVAALDANTGLATPWNPGANDVVREIAVNGSTVYLAGQFSYVGGVRRVGLAAVTTAGVVTSWDPEIGGSDAIAFNGSTVYVGGKAVDATTGLATGWNPDPNQVVHALATSGTNVYIGGDFTSVGGQRIGILASVNSTTGHPTSWNPAPNGGVVALVMNAGTLYVGGSFHPPMAGPPTSIGGQARRFLAALDPVTGNATPWNPGADGPVAAMAIGGSTLYVSGNFTAVGGQARQGLAAVDLSSGAVGAFAPAADGSATVLGASGSTVYVAGSFTHIGGQARNHFAALDGATGFATSWNPNLTGDVSAVAVNGSTVYVGGTFSMIGGQPRSNIAALDAVTGLATAWNPGADGPVTAITIDGPWAYVGGTFANVGGEARFGMAALDTSTGLAQPNWSPSSAGGSVAILAVSQPTVYAAGSFTNVDGVFQSNLAVLGDVSTPTLISLERVDSAPGHVTLTWYSAVGGVLGTVYRRTATSEWQSLAVIYADGSGRMAYDDEHVAAGVRYEYRLGVASSTTSGEQFFGDTWVTVPSGAQFALAGPRPNPATNKMTVAFSLPNAASAQLEMLDVSGRRVARLEVGALGAGNHTLDLAEGRQLVPGLYFLRLTQGKTTLTARAAFTR
jgi:trimeric autotransporter adhesin